MIFILYLLLSIPFSYSYYNLPRFLIDQGIGVLPAVFKLNETIYIYNLDRTNKHIGPFLSVLDIRDHGYEYRSLTISRLFYYMPFCSHCTVFTINDTSVVFFDALYRPDESNETTKMNLQYYNHDQSEMSLAYERLPLTDVPDGRYYHQAAMSLDHSSIYIFGGTATGGNFSTALDIIKMNISNLAYERFGQFSFAGGTATMLPSGVVVLAFGTPNVNDLRDKLISTGSVYLFDTNTNVLSQKRVNGESPDRRVLATGTLGPDNECIYYFGGSSLNILTPYDRNSYSEIWRGATVPGMVVLNTSSWTWIYPKVTGFPPIDRFGAFSLLYKDNTIVLGGGASSYGELDDFAVLRNLALAGESLESTTIEWYTDSVLDTLYNTTNNGMDNTNGLGKGPIAGIVIGSIVVIVIIFYILWRKVPFFRKTLYSIHHKIIWVPRRGEPFWAEVSRTILRFIMLLLLLAFSVYVIMRAVNSPSIYQIDNRTVKNMPVPNIRICNKPPPNTYPGNFYTTCGLSNGSDCSEYIEPQDISDANASIFVHKFDDSSYYSVCRHFFAPSGLYLNENPLDKVRLDATAVMKSDSIIIRAFNISPVNSFSSFYITYYPPGLDPNKDYEAFTYQELQDWKYTEETLYILTNTLSAPINSYVGLGYTLSETSRLTSAGWNKIGFAYQYDTKLEISQATSMSVTAFNASDYGNPILEIKISPNAFEINSSKEQKVSTILSGLAQVGGVLSLVIAVQAILFGFRPSSPWGIIHRLPSRRLHRSITNQLSNEYDTLNTPVPMATPVHDRFKRYFTGGGINTSDSNSILDDDDGLIKKHSNEWNRLQERVQLIEVLLKNYYIDDEVFQQLENSRRTKYSQDSSSDKTNEEIPLTRVSRARRDSEDIV